MGFQKFTKIENTCALTRAPKGMISRTVHRQFLGTHNRSCSPNNPVTSVSKLRKSLNRQCSAHAAQNWRSCQRRAAWDYGHPFYCQNRCPSLLNCTPIVVFHARFLKSVCTHKKRLEQLRLQKKTESVTVSRDKKCFWVECTASLWTG